MKISRRGFIGTGLVAPLILHAQDKAGTKAPVLGSGDWTYEWIGDWGICRLTSSGETRTM